MLVPLAVLAAFGFSRHAAAGDLDSQSRLLDAAAASRSAASVAEEVGAQYVNLAGSRENAVKLAKGLHTGNVIALRTPDANGYSSLIAFDLPNGGMSWGDVQATLALTQSTLAGHGIRNPTGAQVHAALLGGTLTKANGATVEIEGVVKMRSIGSVAVSGANGMPIYSPVPEPPVIRNSPWANYRPTQRPSSQIEHQTGVILAGFLR